jgi:hypothetical protein
MTGYANTGYSVDGYAAAASDVGLYMDAGYVADGYADGSFSVGNYVSSGYVSTGYAVGDIPTAPTPGFVTISDSAPWLVTLSDAQI